MILNHMIPYHDIKTSFYSVLNTRSCVLCHFERSYVISGLYPKTLTQKPCFLNNFKKPNKNQKRSFFKCELKHVFFMDLNKYL